MRHYHWLIMAALLAGCTKQPANVSPPSTRGMESAQGGKLTIAMMPKLKGIPYFNACEKGAREAAAELGVELIFDGPVEDKADLQNQILDAWIVQQVDAIAFAANDPEAITPYLEKARKAGIHVVGYDADSLPSGREFFLNQATFEAIGNALVDEMAAQAGDDAEVAIVTSSLTAPNQNEWMKWMKKRMAEGYPQMKLLDVKPAGESLQEALRITKDLIKTHAGLDGVFGISSVAFPGAADAVRQMGLSGKVAVVGLSTPSDMREFVEDGTVKTVILWNAVDLGYLAVYAAKALIDGDLKPGMKTLNAGRLGEKKIVGDQILLGEPMRFTAENIADYDF